MTYWSIAAIIFSALFLAYRRLAMSWNILPQWLVPETWRTDDQATQPVDDIPEKHANTGITAGVRTPEQKPKQPESESTPTAKPAETAVSVPTFSLSGDDQHDGEEKSSSPARSTPMFPAANSAQRASTMPPPPKPASKPAKGIAPSLMLPPSRPAVFNRAPPPSAAASLRIPTTGPLPNRGPPANSQQRASAGLSPNGAISTPNARGKVLLSPGHSPMDWAALTRSGNLAGVNTFQRVTPSQLRSMTGRKGKPAWSSWQGKVYNITPYLPFHPGGEPELMKAVGRDGTKLFMDVHPWVNWENMLSSCLVGVLVPENHGISEGESSLEDMD